MHEICSGYLRGIHLDELPEDEWDDLDAEFQHIDEFEEDDDFDEFSRSVEVFQDSISRVFRT